MSHRLQVLIPEPLEEQIRKAAQRTGVSKGEWVRRAIEEALGHSTGGKPYRDPLRELAGLQAPTGDIQSMLAEIEAGRE